MSKERENPFRGLKRRRDRIENDKERANLERMMFEIKRDKKIAVWVKDVKNDYTPTDYFVVEFHLKEKTTLKDFEELIFEELGVLVI